jgi:hypothetical protein
LPTAAAWFCSDDTTLGSFRWARPLLGFDPAAVRSALAG